MIELMLFDADGVIQTTPPEWLPALKALTPTGGEEDKLLQDIFAAEKPCLTGEKVFADALLPVLSDWGIKLPVQDVLNIWTMIDPVEVNLNVVSELRQQGVRTGLATNQQNHRAEYMRSALAYDSHFDHLFISCEMRVAKPDPDYFRKIAQMMGLAPTAIAFVDDHAGNVDAAKSAGLSGAVYDLATGEQGLRAAIAEAGLKGGLA